MNKYSRSLTFSSVLGAVLLLGGAGCSGDGSERPRDERATVAVQVVAVSSESWSDGLEVTASVKPRARATPGTVLMGRVGVVRVEEGDAVSRGQVLADIESRDVGARLAQATAGVAAAKAMEKNARLMRERIERLHSRDAASEKDLEDARAGHEAAIAQLNAADEAVKVAEVQVEYSRVAAPFDGVVVEKRVVTGDTATPGVPLFVIDDLDQVKIEAEVPESAATGLAVGDPVWISFQGETLAGELSELVPAADPRSRTFTVRALLDNPERKLRPGMFARLTVPGAERAAVTLPRSSIVRRGPLTGVFVVDRAQDGPSRARLRWITLGAERGERVEVLTGLEPGEQVVLDADVRLGDGQTVEVRG